MSELNEIKHSKNVNLIETSLNASKITNENDDFDNDDAYVIMKDDDYEIEINSLHETGNEIESLNYEIDETNSNNKYRKASNKVMPSYDDVNDEDATNVDVIESFYNKQQNKEKMNKYQKRIYSGETNEEDNGDEDEDEDDDERTNRINSNHRIRQTSESIYEIEMNLVENDLQITDMKF
jgi:hypothetical protein